MQRPWDLATALSNRGVVKPGDTLWLRGGRYVIRSRVTSTLRGLPGLPINVAAYPGERVILDAAGTSQSHEILRVEGEWTTFMGFEVTDSRLTRTDPAPGAFEVRGDNLKFINLIVHDYGQGFVASRFAENAEFYGNIIYYHGQNTRQHGMYPQNDPPGTKRFIDNIIFSNAGYGIHAYGLNGTLDGLYLEGNVMFNNGMLQGEGVRKTNVLVGGSQPAERVTLVQNYTYHTPKYGGVNVALGWAVDGNKTATVTDNYFVGGDIIINLNKSWENLLLQHNLIYGRTFLASLPLGVEPRGYGWDQNEYFGSRSTPFRFHGKEMTFAEWQNATGLDRNSRFMAAPPQGIHVFLRPNRYAPGRAHIIVYNWDKKPSIDLDVSTVLRVGDYYEVRDAQNYFGSPVASGRYEGDAIRLPLTLTRVTQPVGLKTQMKHTAPEFAVFVLTSRRAF